MAAITHTFSVPLVGGGWLSSRRRPDALGCLRRQLRDLQRGAKILGLPFSVNPRHRSFLSPVPTHSPFYPWGINHLKDAERRLLSSAPVVIRLCRTCLWSRIYPHKMTLSICSFPALEFACQGHVCVSSSASSLDRRFPSPQRARDHIALS
jgi:hypothetical protein